MKHALAIVLALAGCSSKKSDSAGSGSSAPGSGSSSSGSSAAGSAAATAEGPDGLPPGYKLPDGAKLVDHKGTTWTYSVARPPAAVAEELEAKLTSATWIAAVRHPAPDVPAVLAVQGTSMVAAAATPDPAGTMLNVSVAPASKAPATAPPTGYPAGFPFVPFAKLAPDDRKDRFRMIYVATAAEIEEDLNKRAQALGWTCHGSTDTIAVCRKGGAETSVTIKKLDDTSVAMFVNIEKPGP